MKFLCKVLCGTGFAFCELAAAYLFGVRGLLLVIAASSAAVGLMALVTDEDGLGWGEPPECNADKDGAEDE